MATQRSSHGRPNLSAVPNAFSRRVTELIEKINQVPAGSTLRKGKYANKSGLYGPYSNMYKLNLSWLAELVAHAMHYKLSQEDILRMLRTNARTLPKDLVERQNFLEHVEKVLLRCARIAGHDLEFDLVEEFMPPGQSTPPSLNPLGFNPEDLGFFWLSSWNPGRPMTTENVGKIKVVDRAEVIASHRPNPGWIRDQDLYDRLLTQARIDRMGQPCPSLVAVKPDEREGGDSERLELAVCKSMYSDHVALRNYMRTDHEAYDALRRRITDHHYTDGISESLADIIRVSPLSNIAINVTVQSRRGRVMLIRRPTHARVWRSFYQVGAHETMNWPGPNLDVENWYELAQRALREEIGLPDPADYYGRERIVFSWFGFYMPEASGYFFAHVKTRLTESELIDAVAMAEGRLEAEAIEWFDLTRSNVHHVLQCWSRSPWENDAVPDSNGRRWLPHATMSLTELLRATEQGMLNF